MSVIYILITVSIVVAVVFLVAFVKAVRSGQYDDDYTPSVRMLFEDEIIKTNTNPTPDSSKKESKINKE
jgi:cbb3-type cytochrome oxidase maturation protein